jgi:predicted NBD/HSP70 family sugar kinase
VPILHLVKVPDVAAIPPLLKDLNERTVLDTIRAGAPISRAEISRRAGISKPTVSLALQSLLHAGLVREAAPEGDGPSYGAVFFEPVPEAALFVGIDLGARFVRGAVCDLSGHVRARQDVELRNANAATALETITELVETLVEVSGFARELVDGVVVGVPGAVDATDTTIRLATNVADLEGTAFPTALGASLQLPVTVENDVNLAAVGERWQGVARGVDDFAFLSIGTGMGAGLVLGGELHRGRHGTAGEVDYAFGGFGEDVDPCADAVVELAQAAASGNGTAMRPPFDARDVFAAARAGDAAAASVVTEVARRIALHAVPFAVAVDVDLVVLGGGIGANGDLILEPVRGHLGEWLPYAPRVEVSALGEAAVLTGALAVGRRAAIDNSFANRARVPG